MFEIQLFQRDGKSIKESSGLWSAALIRRDISPSKVIPPIERVWAYYLTYCFIFQYKYKKLFVLFNWFLSEKFKQNDNLSAKSLVNCNSYFSNKHVF